MDGSPAHRGTAGVAKEANQAAAHPGARERLIVAIDGPAGAGKSTVAARMAARFGLLNLETGAMYRGLAWKALRAGVASSDAEGLGALLQSTRIELVASPAQGNSVFVDGVDVTGELRSPEVSQAASEVSVHPAVRAWMVARQRELGRAGGVIMEGRDVGTAIFPQAPVKVFLDASPEARTERRALQSGESRRGTAEELRERDARDRSRAASPLQPAPDAVVIDSTRLTLDQVCEQVAALITAQLL
jgi:CMP/dCMP kinase